MPLCVAPSLQDVEIAPQKRQDGERRACWEGHAALWVSPTVRQFEANSAPARERQLPDRYLVIDL